MALVVGTNVGFVRVRPTADLAGTAGTAGKAMLSTAPLALTVVVENV